VRGRERERGGVSGNKLRLRRAAARRLARDAIAPGGDELRLGGLCEGASATAAA